MVAVSLASDDRARVPFALVGVLLLLGASVYATGIADRAQPSIERPAAAAMDSVSRDTRPALWDAVRDAARESIRTPVTTPANTTAGRELNDSRPFVDALRLRIAVAARESVSELSRERGGVRATVGLPAVDGSTASLREAKSGVEVTPVDGGAAMRVTVRNLTVSAREDGRTVAQRQRNVSLTVETPALALHQRARAYERRLNRGALEGPGLARGLTTRLTAVAMARGYGRYAGAPIRNVLGNRHVELSANAVLLAQQRAAFGRHDIAGARAVDIATLKVGVLDVLGGRHGDAATATKALVNPNAVDGATRESTSGEFAPKRPDAPPVNVSPDAAADRAYLGSVEGTPTAGSYRVRSDLRVSVLSRTSESKPKPRLQNWTLVEARTTERTSVEDVSTGSSEAVVDTVLDVTVHYAVERHWTRNGTSRTTTAEWTETARVAVEVTTEYAPTDAAPERSTEPLFEPGGALDGPNLDGARERAADALLDANGGIDSVAERVATGNGGADALVRQRTITATRPADLDAWVAADLRELRREVANVSVSIPRAAVASGDANAPARLAAELRERRSALLDAPATYDGAADRARVAARAAYLDRVLAELDARASKASDRNVDYRDELGDRATARISQLIELGRGEASEQPADAYVASGGPDDLVITPDASPAYLTLQSIDHEQAPSVPAGESAHPLTARTTNWVALPYGDAASGIVDTILGGGSRQVRLGTAAGTLIAANRTAAPDPEGKSTALTANRDELAAAVRSSVGEVERAVCDAATNGTGVGRPTCRAAVVDARDQWPTLGHRAQAMANGSYGSAFGAVLRAHGVDTATADEASVRVRVRLRELSAERETGVPAATTNRTASMVQQAARETVRKQVSGSLENASARATRKLTGASRLPAGIPVAPPPYTWIATANAWSVTVRGEYQRFALRARGVAPDGSGGTVRYVRDGSTVRLDVDGDGDRERLGRGDRVGFGASTTVVAVVPPGMPGVGDVDGARDEQSPGWPCPGVDGGSDCETATGTE
ncbi:hypothetical protein B4589_014885 [Halolamina sp. CBA1230]|uniref:DUF7286 family protein n=1 Tax=Halolamina sp. CBA1230 TaxID=1853690 RepID=UPI0009A245D7|nr:hypothetical protein [Halolamina sp. CBA1230]QKY21596.1 hypothetical protein B4589_014885 [Halolamina sp. CBA1230]